MAEKCKSPRCNCKDTHERGYCSEFCEWFHTRLIRHGTVGDTKKILPKDLDLVMLDLALKRELLLTLKSRG